MALRASLVAVLLAPMAAPTAGANTASRFDGHPSLAQIADGPALIKDTTVRKAAAGPGFWGGTYTTSTGEHVTLYVSRSYPQDDAYAQNWANFFGNLVHGSELSSVVVYLMTPTEVSQACGGGEGVLGCYGNNTLYGPGEDAPDIAAEAVLTHEYGHHVAAHRVDAPWTALDWGTKRWSSYINVCTRARAHKLFPGAENALEYMLNPGEGFAESYRVLNETLHGLPVTPWQVVDPTLQPDQTALNLLQQDVLSPWTGNHTVSFSGTFRARGSSVRTFSVHTPLDGTFAIGVQSRAHVRVQLVAAGHVVSRGVTSASTTICGTRAYSVRVTRTSGSGAFALSVSLP